MNKINDWLSRFDFKKWGPLILRLGLGLTLIYAGFAMWSDPTSWVGYVPDWVTIVSSKEHFTFATAILDLFLGVSLIAGFLLPIISFIVFSHLASILVFHGIDAVTFRDFGLAAMALVLCLESLPDLSSQA